MREAGENPAQYPLPYAWEAAARGVSRSLGGPEKAERQARGLSHGPTPREPEDL